MKIVKIKIDNFRLLKTFELDVEKDLSLIIGKNNCGKTSLLSILDKFINGSGKSPFSYDDFNLEFQRELEEKVSKEIEQPYIALGISLKLFIEYDEADDLSNISKLMMDLDPKNKMIVLYFGYTLTEEYYVKLKNEYYEFVQKRSEAKAKEQNKPETEVTQNLFNDFMCDNHKKFFTISRKSIGYDYTNSKENPNEFIDLLKECISIDNIINFKVISARRNVSNSETDKTLSALSSRYYDKKEETEVSSDEIQKFKDVLCDTDKHLDEVYSSLFKKVIDKVEQFGGVKKGESIIKIISSLQHKELLKGNTTVKYEHSNEHTLPESYNGLGYLNLISMIFEIELLINDFRRDSNEYKVPADINLLFLEEPEAHTHPQMQYIFIKNIKDILQKASGGEDGGTEFNLQTVISTHSSHITSESEFNDIKYFYKVDNNHVIAKNIRDLEKEYDKDGETQNFKFLKQYLTLHRAELFFADKAIFIEGDTERILLPAMMKKVDQQEKDNPLLSQNISIIEVGAYSHIFDKFIDFVGIKSLIITDIDSAKIVEYEENGKKKTKTNKCRVADAEVAITTNAALKYFHKFSLDEYSKSAQGNENELTYFVGLPLCNKELYKDKTDKMWKQKVNGNLLLIYQIEEENKDGVKYSARSFEDAFFHVNRQFIIDNEAGFSSLKNFDLFKDMQNDSYKLADSCIDKKPSFAMEILISSTTDAKGNEFCNWEIPLYIKDGLLWLKKD